MDLVKIRQAAERVARSEGLEIADVEWKVGKDRLLRVYIDRVPEGFRPPEEMGAAGNGSGSVGEPENDSPLNGAIAAPAFSGPPVNPFPKITHGDCERVSQQLSVILDVEDLIPGPPYILEVSSPGMDRALRKPADFHRFNGRLARITTTELVEQSKSFEGRLVGFADGKVRVRLLGKQERVVELPLQLIRKANLVVEF